MPKRDKLDKSQEEGQGPEELDITQILSEVNDYEELGPDQSAMDAYGMTDPALGGCGPYFAGGPGRTGRVKGSASGNRGGGRRRFRRRIPGPGVSGCL